jgi:predicted ester cyclase
MSTPRPVEAFYSKIWNDGDLSAASELLSEGFSFRGSLGSELRGRNAFTEYVQSVRAALADYHCEVLDCVAEGNQAFAKMLFSGIHVAPFRGHQPTRKSVHWLGAALFTFDGDVINELWVLGDLVGLDAVLQSNA